MRAGAVVTVSLAASLLAASAAAQLASPAAPAAPAAPGRYDGQLCVATSPDVETSCGAAEIDVASARRLSVRVADVVYRIALREAQLDVKLSQGRMQIDEFSAAYKWSGATLLFGDPEKDARYEVRFGAKKRASHS